MIERKIDINKIFNDGFFITYVNEGISALFKKRIEQIKTGEGSRRMIGENEIRPPISNVFESIQAELNDVLKLFSQNSSKTLKKVELIEISAQKDQALDNLQSRQPALGCVALPPGVQKDAFKIFKVLYKHNGEVANQELIYTIKSERDKVTLILFNASSLIYRWSIENKGHQSKKAILALFEEIDCV